MPSRPARLGQNRIRLAWNEPSSGSKETSATNTKIGPRRPTNLGAPGSPQASAPNTNAAPIQATKGRLGNESARRCHLSALAPNHLHTSCWSEDVSHGGGDV